MVPITTGLSRQLADLSPEQLEFLHRCLRNAAKSRERLSIPIARQPRSSRRYPLSFAQERLWLVEEFSDTAGAYNIPIAVRLTGRLLLAPFVSALREILRRHGALRMTFHDVGGIPEQLETAEARPCLPIIDLRSLSPERRQATVQHLMDDEARRRFDLERGPLLRTTLLQLDRESYVLLLTMHHIASDRWSFDLFLREFVELYTGLVQGKRPSLLELPVQYTDYAIWQREQLHSGELERLLGYWRKALAGAPAVLSLRTDRPRPAVQSFRGARQVRLLPADLIQGLNALGRQRDATSFMVLLAGFAVWLHGYSGQEDFLVGSPVAGRIRSELEPLIGFFVNTLALRADLTGDPPFTLILDRIREVVLGAHAHQDLPFSKLVEDLRLERVPSRQPLIQVLFIPEPSPIGSLALPDLEVEPLETLSGSVKFDLSVSLMEIQEGIRVFFDSSTDLFETSTAEEMADSLEPVLRRLLAEPESRLHSVTERMAAERERRRDERRQQMKDSNLKALGAVKRRATPV